MPHHKDPNHHQRANRRNPLRARGEGFGARLGIVPAQRRSFVAGYFAGCGQGLSWHTQTPCIEPDALQVKQKTSPDVLAKTIQPQPRGLQGKDRACEPLCEMFQNFTAPLPQQTTKTLVANVVSLRYLQLPTQVLGHI